MVDRSSAAESSAGTEAAEPARLPADEEVFQRFPRIRLDQVNIEYYRGLLVRELRAGWCSHCLRWHTPLRPICPNCWATDITVRPVRGVGTVHLLTRLHQGPPVVDYAPPWPLAAIELTEQVGLRIAATLVDTPDPLQRIGQPVELVWIDREGAPWPAFRAVTGKENAR
jgi:uncharacterized OB-fold protein